MNLVQPLLSIMLFLFFLLLCYLLLQASQRRNKIGIHAFFAGDSHRYFNYLSDRFKELIPRKIKAVSLTGEFKSNCWYRDPQEPGQINKLFGFSSLFIHRNSLRIGWRPCKEEEGVIELHLYCYVNGVRHTQLLEKVVVERPFTIQLEPRSFQQRFRYGWLCLPFFGGVMSTPRPMTIILLGEFHEG